MNLLGLAQELPLGTPRPSLILGKAKPQELRCPRLLINLGQRELEEYISVI